MSCGGGGRGHFWSGVRSGRWGGGGGAANVFTPSRRNVVDRSLDLRTTQCQATAGSALGVLRCIKHAQEELFVLMYFRVLESTRIPCTPPSYLCFVR